jgi:uncharacterized membrane protein YtjA (UPF0391 family)
MLQYATVFLIIALVAGIFGIGAVATGAAEVAEFLFLAFIALVAGAVVAGLRHRDVEWIADRVEPERRGNDPAIADLGHE